MYSVILMAAMSTSPVTPDGLFFNRGGGCCGGERAHLFHKGNGCCGAPAETCCAPAPQACGCCGGSGGPANMRAVNCPSCPGGVRYEYAYGDSGNVNTIQQFAVPDGRGGYKTVTASGNWNGLPIVDPNAQPSVATQAPVPAPMPSGPRQ